MKAPLVRELSKRPLYLQKEESQKCYRILKANSIFPLSWWSRHKLCIIPPKKLRNRCIVTNRGKAINKTFKLSRLEFRRWVRDFLLPGVEKSSW